MDIRRAQPGDYDEALRLVKQVHYMHYEHLSYLYNDIEPLPRDRFYEDLSNPDMITLMAFDGGVAVGICEVEFKHTGNNPVMRPRRVAYINDICVDENARGRGIGRALYARPRAESQARDCDSIELMVWGFNENALKFYKALGMDVRSYVMQDRLKLDD